MISHVTKRLISYLYNIRRIISLPSPPFEKKRTFAIIPSILSRNTRSRSAIEGIEITQRAAWKRPAERKSPYPSRFHSRNHRHSDRVVIQDSISLHLHTPETRVEIKIERGVEMYLCQEHRRYVSVRLNETERMLCHVRILERFFKKVSLIAELEYYKSINDFCRKSIASRVTKLTRWMGWDLYGTGRWIDRLSRWRRALRRIPPW